jgi:hypothetical protein
LYHLPQESLLEGNYEHFDENVEENKLIYTEIYQVSISQTFYMRNLRLQQNKLAQWNSALLKM